MSNLFYFFIQKYFIVNIHYLCTMGILTFNNVRFTTEKFIGWSKAKFESVYQEHISEAGKVFDLIQKVNEQANKPIEQSSEVEPIGTAPTSGNKSKGRKVNTGSKQD